MPKLKVELAEKTDPNWVHTLLGNFDEFLKDHADCERKASAMAMHFVAKCPDRVEMMPGMIDLALEELQHFKQVYDIMEKRGIALTTHVEQDQYVNNLLDLCRSDRESRFLDRLLVAAIIETRGTERFKLVSQALTDEELKIFYKNLYVAEARHGNFFLEVAALYYDEAVIEERLAELVAAESKILRSLPWRPTLH